MNPNCCRDSLPQVTLGILESTQLTKGTEENEYFLAGFLAWATSSNWKNQRRPTSWIYPNTPIVWNSKLVTALRLLHAG